MLDFFGILAYNISYAEKQRSKTPSMLQVLTPDCVFDTIFEVTPEFLRQRGIRGALIDIDGTVSSHRAALPEERLRVVSFQ